MQEVGFQDLRSSSGFRARDFSPDSVMFTSLFSSASGSVERSSFTSDVPDQDSFTSVGSQHLTGNEVLSSSNGPDPDPKKLTLLVHKNTLSLSRKDNNNNNKINKVQILDSSEAETTEDENVALDSARNSFSQAIKECQDRRLRSGKALSKKTNRQRPASLDLNNSLIHTMNSISPRLGVIKKPSPPTLKTAGSFPSPGTPNYRHASVGIQKGWSSERVPQHINANRRNVSTALLPYNTTGRTLPSKWEDAERWIFSPVSGDGALRTSVQQPQRRPKSKSGPLGPPGVAYYQLFSPAGPAFDGAHNGKLIANSPFSAGVMGADGLSVRYGGCDGGGNFLMGNEPCMGRSISIHGCSEMLRQSSLPGQRDEKHECNEDSANNISRAVSRRDMATQMSPDQSSSNHSSPNRRTSSSISLATPTILPLVELHNKIHSSKTEIRDVPVDERVTVTRWSKKNRGKNPVTGSRNADDDWKRKAVNVPSASWEVSSETSKSISKAQREEAKIAAWENLQKAKAESRIRKLEMKLEKKRSSSMDKIMNKLRSAQKKAQEMRSSVLANQAGHQIARSSDRTLSFRRTTRQIGSLSGCFTCHAF